MQKESLTLRNITKDLKKAADCHMSNVDDWRLSYIIPFTLLALLLGILLKRFWVGALIFLPAVYHIVRYSMDISAHRKRMQAIRGVIDRGDIAISVETLSHIAKETVYEPHTSARRAHSTKEITVYYFESGGSFRIPNCNKHYDWSETFYLTSKGLENISIGGDEFFCVSLQGYGDIAYIYPCKFFVLDSTLI
ncbi:MAG: hypothetical protein IJW46_05965 [Clostridia bacterium]|nr:hypothetical protein [Clostridia bacterium]